MRKLCLEINNASKHNELSRSFTSKTQNNINKKTSAVFHYIMLSFLCNKARGPNFSDFWSTLNGNNTVEGESQIQNVVS